MTNFTFDNFDFDTTKKELLFESEPVSISPKVAELLTVFLERSGEILSRDELMKEIWKDTFVEESNLRFCIYSLRKVLREKNSEKKYIKTVPKRGYRFEAELKENTGDESSGLINGYKIIEKIGVGGMGEVFLAQDERLERKVALKVLLPEVVEDQERIQRFKLEAKAVSALNHPNIVTIYEIGQAGEKLYIAYEFIEGETLRTKIKKNQLTVSDSIKVAEQIAKALSVAHQANIIHRDIKPENIMIRKDGYVKILDFGLAKRINFPAPNHPTNEEDETIEWVKTQKGVIMGSVQYMSPEQSRGLETNEKTDIWSLGVVLYEMLTGINPFEGETLSDSVAAILHFQPDSINKNLEEFPTELGKIIKKALRSDLSERYQNIENFAGALKAVRKNLSDDVLTKRIIFDSLTKDTVRFQPRPTNGETVLDEKNDLPADNNFSKNEEYVIENKKRLKRSKKWLLIPVTVIFGVTLFFIYNSLHFLFFPNYYDRFQKHRITRLTKDGNSGRAAISDDRKWLAYVRKSEEKQSLMIRQMSTGKEGTIKTISNGEILQPTFGPPQKNIYGINNEPLKTLYFVVKNESSSILYSVDYGVNYFERLHPVKQLTDIDSRISFSPNGQKFAFIRQNPEEKVSSVFTLPTDLRKNNVSLEKKVSSKNSLVEKFTDVVWKNEKEEFSIIGTRSFEDTNSVNTQPEYIETGTRKDRFISGSERQIEWMKNDSVVQLGFRNLIFQPSFWYRGSPIRMYFSNGEITSFDATPDAKSLVLTTRNTNPTVWQIDPQSQEKKQLVNNFFAIDSVSPIIQLPNKRLLFSGKKIEKEENISVFNFKEFKFSGYGLFLTSVDIDGKNPIKLAPCKGKCFNLVATSDGKHILYESNGIWRVDANGKNPVQLTPIGTGNFKIALDNETIIYKKFTRNKDTYTLMKTSINGGEPTQLTESSGSFQITPDGKNVVFVKTKGNHLYLMKISINGGKPSEIIKFDNSSAVWIHNFEFFDEGKKLAFLGFDRIKKFTVKPNRKLYIVSLDNSLSKQSLVEKDFDGFDFKISPDEKWLLSRNKKGIARMPLRSISSKPEIEQILSIESGRISTFNWTDDNKIIYFHHRDSQDIYLVEDVE